MKKFGLEQKSIEVMNNIFEQYEQIEQVIIYGSRAMGNFRAGSDIDLTIKADRFSFSDVAAIENQIDDLMLPYKIDISLFHQIEDPDLLAHIKRAGRVFYKNKMSS